MFSTPDEAIFSGKNNDNLELLLAWAGTTVAYAIVQAGAANLLSGIFVQALAISGVVCGLGFVFHELAHRIVARHYGAQAHFVADKRWLGMSILIAFAGFFIAAPGAVWHRGRLTLQQGGLIALAGPVTNLVLAVLFIFLLPVLVLANQREDWVVSLCVTGVRLNAWLGLFNMIPAGPFDGAKVLAWNKVVFGVTVAVAFVLTFVIPSNLAAIWGALLGLFGN